MGDIVINGKLQKCIDYNKTSNDLHRVLMEQSQKLFEEHRLKELGKSKEQHTPILRENKKIGRNDLCLCGSGKKFKKCCMDKK